MKTKIAATCFLISSLLVPVAAYAGVDQAVATAGTMVTDSVITTKIKAKLAEEKFSSAMHIRVKTDSKGAVRLGGSAKTRADADKAVAIARGVEGVVSVKDNIRTGDMRKHSRAAKVPHAERVEARIAEMHAKLQITQAQEAQWSKVAESMRENAKQMDALTKTRAEKSNMNAIDDLNSFSEIADAHAKGLAKFTPIFKTLYDDMSDIQKANADVVFRHGGHQRSKHHS